MNRLILLTTSPRVAPGLLCSRAWEALREADRVFSRDPVHAQAPYVHGAGVNIEILQDDDSAESPLDDSHVAQALLAAAREGTVVYLSGPDGEPELGRALAAQLPPLLSAGVAPELEVLPGSWDLPGARVLDLVAVMDRLRSPGGCPWDARQTHESLVTYLIEETYEAIEAIEAGDPDSLREELGDVLLQVAFHARLAEEHPERPWSIDDVAIAIVEKLVRRHPHVFGSEAGTSAGQEPYDLKPGGGIPAGEMESHESLWQQMKTAEKDRESVLDGVPLGQPALSLAAKVLARVERGGLDIPVPAEPSSDEMSADLGHRIFRVVAEARAAGVDPEAALRAAVRSYSVRVREIEGGVSTSG